MKFRSKPLGAEIAGKEDALALAPNPAVREMIGHLDEQGVETILDRFESQQPQCNFGLRGLCCRMCQWGPCRISAKSPRGVCGRSMETIVIANMLRAVAAGASAQSAHTLELAMTVLGAARGEIALPLRGVERIEEVAERLGVAEPGLTPEQLAERIARVMLEDLGRLEAGEMRSLAAFAPEERRSAWEQLDVLPRSASYEVLEAMHRTTLGACSDWVQLALQAVRTGLAYAYAGLFNSSFLSDMLFGIPEPRTAEVNYGILKADHINLLVHGHSPVMAEKVLEKLRSPEVEQAVREAGAAGIVVGGMCCSGDEMLARYGVPTVASAMGQELVLGTGAVDLVVVDMQCVIPGLKAVADCFGTEIVTTCKSNRIPGATHIPFDPEHPESLDEDAERIVRIAIEAFARRDRSVIRIPAHKTPVMTGFTGETVLDAFGGVDGLLTELREGRIRGIVGMVGCNTPKVPYELGHVTIAREMAREGVLVLTSGCSAHALLNAGLCAPDAASGAASGLREACERGGVPSALAVGSCADNTRMLRLFFELAEKAGLPIAEMPFILSGPELSNEKTMGQGVTFLAHGITAVVGLTPSLPIPAMGPKIEPSEGAAPGRNAMTDFFCDEGLPSLLGSRLIIEPDPHKAAERLLSGIAEKRLALGWDTADEAVPA